jgi:predicted nucleic acid-binding Zn ribbon protein
VLEHLTSTMGWDSPLARAELLAGWPAIVGTDTAAHASPIGIEDGLLTVRCDSTAWATQLRVMGSRITTEIATRFPAAGIESVKFLGPDTPSWKRGPRAIPGRGPRDTYG